MNIPNLRPTHLYVEHKWRFRFNRCCEYHWLNIEVGHHIWRWER